MYCTTKGFDIILIDNSCNLWRPHTNDTDFYCSTSMWDFEWKTKIEAERDLSILLRNFV